VGVQVRWEKGDTERAEDYTFFYGEVKEDYTGLRRFCGNDNNR
jgi:hypothetical protein